MYCPHCGTSTEDDHAYCHSCGAVLPGARNWVMTPAPIPGLLSKLGDPGVRLLAYTLAGLAAMLVIGALFKMVVGLALPLLIVLAIVYWARERRRRYY